MVHDVGGVVWRDWSRWHDEGEEVLSVYVHFCVMRSGGQPRMAERDRKELRTAESAKTGASSSLAKRPWQQPCSTAVMLGPRRTAPQDARPTAMAGGVRPGVPDDLVPQGDVARAAVPQLAPQLVDVPSTSCASA